MSPPLVLVVTPGPGMPTVITIVGGRAPAGQPDFAAISCCWAVPPSHDFRYLRSSERRRVRGDWRGAPPGEAVKRHDPERADLGAGVQAGLAARPCGSEFPRRRAADETGSDGESCRAGGGLSGADRPGPERGRDGRRGPGAGGPGACGPGAGGPGQLRAPDDAGNVGPAGLQVRRAGQGPRADDVRLPGSWRGARVLHAAGAGHGLRRPRPADGRLARRSSSSTPSAIRPCRRICRSSIPRSGCPLRC